MATWCNRVDDLVPAVQVEVGQRFIEEKEARFAGQGVGDEDALLFATRQVPTRWSAKASAPTAANISSTRARRARDGVGMPKRCAVDAQLHEVAGPHGQIGVEDDLLGHIADEPACARAPPVTSTCPPSGRCSPRMTRSKVVLPAPLEPMRPVNSPAATVKVTSSSTHDRTM